MLLEIKASLKEDSIRRDALGQLIRGMEHVMREQPLRKHAVGLAVGATSVEAVWAVRQPNRQLIMYHQGPVPLELSEQSEGLDLLLRLVTAHPDQVGHVKMPQAIRGLR
jgi:hypothetical protein